MCKTSLANHRWEGVSGRGICLHHRNILARAPPWPCYQTLLPLAPPLLLGSSYDATALLVSQFSLTL